MTTAAQIPVITVDGPSGVGKGTLSRRIAAQLRWHRLDSGALYRILALAAVDRGIALDRVDEVADLAAGLDIRFLGDSEDDERILVDGRDRAREVRAETTGALASQIAAAPVVRSALLQRQRDFRTPPGLVADGRDMGTVVFADAPLKLYLTATPEERARRRAQQLSSMGVAVIVDDLCKEIRARDERDSTRAVAPLVPAADAIVIDTTALDRLQVFEQVEGLLRDRGWMP